jgi:hypothetical protein
VSLWLPTIHFKVLQTENETRINYNKRLIAASYFVADQRSPGHWHSSKLTPDPIAGYRKRESDTEVLRVHGGVGSSCFLVFSVHSQINSTSSGESLTSLCTKAYEARGMVPPRH